jgi:hypothetical protein
MKIETTRLEVKSLNGYSQKGFLSGIQVLPSGELLVGSAFASPALRKVSWSAEEVSVEDLKLEDELGDDVLGIVGGFHLSERGDLDIVALHEGSLPKWIRKIFGKDFSTKSGSGLAEYLSAQGGAMGAQTSHLQWKDGKFNVRRYKEPGMTWDLHFLGDYVFVMFAGYLARERYLHLQPEKRETLRNGLADNRALHRSDDGTFWMLGNNGRLQRFQYTENKAKPTPLKFPGFEESPVFAVSAASSTDGWLYGVGGDQRTLFRARRNPVSFEEELQIVWKSEASITALVAVDRAENAKMIAATEGGSLHGLAIQRAEDQEALPPLPSPENLGHIEDVKHVSSLTFDAGRGIVWGVEGGFGSASSQSKPDSCSIIRITEI